MNYFDYFLFSFFALFDYFALFCLADFIHNFLYKLAYMLFLVMEVMDFSYTGRYHNTLPSMIGQGGHINICTTQ